MDKRRPSSERTNFPELYARSGAVRFGIALLEFEQILQTVAAKYLPEHTTVKERIGFYDGLHLADLALARACASGREEAWAFFFERYGRKLYWSACRLVKDKLRASELADTLCSDLFSSTGNRSESKLASYTGRGSLEAWLKVTLAQANIDLYRSERRYAPFEDIAASISCPPSLTSGFAAQPVEDCLKRALRELPPEDRFILAAYYLDHWNLAHVGAVLRVHESTVSRRLGKALRGIRRSVALQLRRRGVPHGSIQESLEKTPQEVSFDVRAELLMGVSISEEPA